MVKETIPIIVADDSPEFLEGLQVLLSTSARYKLLESHKNGRDLIQSELLHDAKIIVTDIEMPHMNGIEAAKRINYRYPKILMVAMTMYYDKVYLEEIVSAGFKAFIYKPEIASQLFDVLEQVQQNKFVFPDYLKIT